VSKYLARLKALDFEKSLTVKTDKSPFDGFDGGVGDGFQKSRAAFDGFDGFQDECFSEAFSDDENLKATTGATVKTVKRSGQTRAAIENLKAPTSCTVKTDTNSWQARVASLEAAGLQRAWAEPFAHLQCGGPPGGFDPAHWERTLPCASIFAEQWAAQACALGWSAEEVFGLDDIAPARRQDRKGLAWLLIDGKRVVALDGVGADIETDRGVRQRFYRRNETISDTRKDDAKNTPKELRP
jgi:hypothetical protein